MEAEYEILRLLRTLGRKILGKDVPMTKEEVICKLTTNEKCKFTADTLGKWELVDLETLLETLEAKVEPIEPVKVGPVKVEPVVPVTKVVTPNEGDTEDETKDEVLSAISDALTKALVPITTRMDELGEQMKAITSHQKRDEDEAKAAFIEALKANKACAFSEDELKGMSVCTLDKLAQSLLPLDFTGRPFPRVHVDDQVEDPPAIEFTKEQRGWKANGA